MSDGKLEQDGVLQIGCTTLSLTLVKLDEAWIDLSRYKTIRLARNGGLIATIKVTEHTDGSESVILMNANNEISHTLEGG